MTTNWGRWPEAPERGALNLVTPEATRRGLACVREGRTLSLGLEISADAPRAPHRAPAQHFLTRDGGDYAAGLTERPGYGYADDTIVLACHGTTHVDALSHVWQDGLMWDGISADNVTSRGASFAGIETMGPVVTRGLFVDARELGFLHGPTDVLRAADVAAALQTAGLDPQPGDALVVRTGWLEDWRNGTSEDDRWQGLHADVGVWAGEAGIAVIGADNISVERNPSGEACALPLHVAAIRDRGIPLLELLDLELMSSQRTSAFCLAFSPLRIRGGSGSPIAPIAIV
ncbi:cyclase family protein [Nocardioides sp.]|uniref:cyclase family protein n=1 Tax=Nocardioides sp. TaxID=35761 RepID=UPI002638DA4F|nr:cyclase family protein [Nocardioides sp.]MCW2737955.1 cyclase [Nocardioides sp.]